MVDTESISMQLIAAAGDAKGCAFEALTEANDGNFEKAEELLKQATAATLPVHKQQMELITATAQGEEVPIDVLLVHAQDHLMNSELAQDLIRELITLYKRVDALEKEVKELKEGK
ncbi:MAG: PTS lactose/cellobiose transporter subunit IIA [Bulleidia sp.]|nr:PTS lactose/cellobiose transporter subunit IIA [Bulleidia sp.]